MEEVNTLAHTLKILGGITKRYAIAVMSAKTNAVWIFNNFWFYLRNCV